MGLTPARYARIGLAARGTSPNEGRSSGQLWRWAPINTPPLRVRSEARSSPFTLRGGDAAGLPIQYHATGAGGKER